MIINVKDVYTGDLLKNKFAYKYFSDGNKLHPLGNVITFLAGVNFENIVRNKAINICMEIPNVNRFTGVCIHKLYNKEQYNRNYYKRYYCVEKKPII